MKIKLKKEIEVEMEVTLPVYLKHSEYTIVKVVSMDLCIIISENYFHSASISESYLTDDNYKPSTQKEFLAMRNKALKYLKSL